MFGADWLNLASPVLGLIAWILPIINLVRQNKDWMVLSIASVSACAISLCMQIFYSNHLVKIEDWSALMDTSGTDALVAAVLLAITIILNAVVVIRSNR